MSRLQERLNEMRRTGAAVPAETAATSTQPASAGGRPSRASRFGGGESFAQPAAPLNEAAAAPISPGNAPVQANPPAAPAPALSRRERFGTAPSPRAPALNQPSTRSIIAAGAALGPAPLPDEETVLHRELAQHCLLMFTLTPQRACDRELALYSAGWYERNQPWALSGLQAMVARALDQQAQNQQPVSAAGAEETAAPASSQPAANESSIEELEERSSFSRAARYGRQRG